ncbi:MAG: SPOR domain-containing protein [Paracoccus sp. (in: a-proteobacteria)]
MRVHALIIIMLVFRTSAVFAQVPQPAEQPPADFRSGQYIDSKGCVFVRDSSGWAARLTNNGRQICGFPPSLTGRANPTADMAVSMTDIERELTVRVMSREGPVGPLADMAAIADVPSSETALMDHAEPLHEAVSRVVRSTDTTRSRDIRAAITRGLHAVPTLAAGPGRDLYPNARLCGLLGMTTVSGELTINSDPTGGLCSGIPEDIRKLRQRRPEDDGPGMTIRVTAKSDSHINKQGHASGSSSEKPLGPDLPDSGPITGTRPHDSDPRNGAGKVRKSAREIPDIDRADIPANARFVQIGRFPHDKAMAVIREIGMMGYPVARERTAKPDMDRIVMAGPFPSRERLIVALNQLRKSGYPAAFAR